LDWGVSGWFLVY